MWGSAPGQLLGHSNRGIIKGFLNGSSGHSNVTLKGKQGYTCNGGKFIGKV